MKRLLGLSLVFLLLVSTFVSCGQSVLNLEAKLAGGAASNQSQSSQESGAQALSQPEQYGTKAPVQSVEPKVKYNDGRDFSDGVAWARAAVKWNCVDKTGKVLFSLDSGDTPVSDFGQDAALVERRDGTQEVVNKAGKVISTPKSGDYDKIESFNKDLGMIVVSRKIDTFDKSEIQTGIINNKGQWFIEPDAKLNGAFATYMGDGVYCWSTPSGASYYLSFYNIITKSTAQMDTGFLGHGPLNFADGYGVLRIDGKICSINDKFEIKQITASRNEAQIGSYHDGLYYYDAYAPDAEGCTKGFFNLEGKKAIDMTKYNIAAKTEDIAFSDGYCLLSLSNPGGTLYYTVIDKTGKMIFEPRQGAPGGKLSCGLFSVLSGKGVSYINTSGETVIEIQTKAFYKICDFKEDAALISTPDGTYYIDKTGKRLF